MAEPKIILFANKYIPAFEVDTGIPFPIEQAFQEKFETDVHFVSYHGEVGDKQYIKWRLRKPTDKESETWMHNYRVLDVLRFEVLTYDIDIIDHKPATPADYESLLKNLSNPKPNITYSTRGGARLIYYIELINNPDLYERTYIGLFDLVDKQIKNINYVLDRSTKDWTRMMRCPYVVRDGCPTYHERLDMHHHIRIDTKGKEIPPPPPKPKYVKPVNLKWRGIAGDRIIARLWPELIDGSFNNTHYRILAYAFGTYSVAVVEGIHMEILNRAEELWGPGGYPENQANSVWRSAERSAERKIKEFENE